MAQDLFGRDAGNLDVKSMMGSLNGQVAQVLETKDVGAEAAMEKVFEAVEAVAAKLDLNAQKDAAEASSYAKEVISAYTDVYKKETKDDQKKKKFETLESKLTRKAIQKITKMGSSPHTFWIGVGHFHGQAIQQLKSVFSSSLIDCGLCGVGSRVSDAVTDASKEASKTHANVTDAHTAALDDNDDGSGGATINKRSWWQFSGDMKKDLINLVSSMSRTLSDAFELNLTDAFKGVLKDSNRIVENMRAVNFQTHGFSEAAKKAEGQFLNTYEATRSSGVNMAKFDAIFLENIQRGAGFMSKREKLGKSESKILERQLRTQKSITTTSLSAASSLGMSAEATNETFMDWHMQLGMSANELAGMGRSMRGISLSTGVTGKNLEAAMKSTDGIMKTMKNAGSLTGAASENVLEMMTLAKKFGVDDVMDPMLKAMSGSGNFMKASKELQQSIITGAINSGNFKGNYDKIQSGSILKDPQAMKELAKGMTINARKAFNNPDNMIGQKMKSLGVDFDNLDFTKLTEMTQSLPVTELGLSFCLLCHY